MGGSSITRIIGVCIGVNDQVSTEVKKPVEPSSFKEEVNCTVYPSIFDTKLNIETSSNRMINVSAILYDLTGKPLLNSSFDILSGVNRHQIDCPATLSKQMFLLRIIDNNSREVLEVLKVIKM
jgi:hypothetical protein